MKNLKIPILISVILTTLMSLTYFRTILYADEEFVVFTFGFELAKDPSKILSWALNSSQSGWETGRWISPISHIFSNLGVMLTYQISNVFGFDLITAYGIARTLLTVGCSVSLVYFVSKLLPPEINLKFRNLTLVLVAVLTPALSISNFFASATRVTIWSYSIFTIIAILTLTLSAQLGAWISYNKKSKKLTIPVSVTIGLLLATTYELSQVLAPVAFAILIYMKFNFSSNFNLYLTSSRRVFKAILNPELLIMFVTYLIPFLIIRLSSLVKCRTGCYQTASLTIDGFRFSDVLNRILSASPITSIPYGLNSDGYWLQSTWVQISMAIFGFIFAGVFLYLVRNGKFGKVTKSNKKSNELKFALFLIFLGILIQVLVAIGMALSVAMQESLAGPPIGQGNRDTLIMNLANSILFTGLFLALFFLLNNRGHFQKAVLIFTIFIFVLSSFAFGSNLMTTRLDNSRTGFFLQSRFATEISNPDLSSYGNLRRCSFVRQRINDFPNWEGHDRTLVYGLNLVFQSKYTIPFCSVTPDFLFKDYAK